ncbi:transporter substrate-binding domain-containing protein [Roseicella aerolata]|uniref:Transporter substrate-binding domain-containing protein n=1 Tax=Roseicella aerolata TaxID=2883479 RepID=A0A9X1IB59_9PROT|nr:transporter substrate-binding domain-containing protein [Roseicella aerolata]MCB4821277.1 transporter substrate-binding domain-containing protein [Roseicella aerolata]
MPRLPCTRRWVLRGAAPLLAAAAIPRGMARAQPVPEAARAALAPTGRLRAALILSNPVLVQRDSATGAPVGVSVELARALAGRLGVPLEPVPYATPAQYAESLAGEIPWDAGFAARDPARGQFLDFSPTFMEVDNVFLVPPGSRLASLADMDQPGVRIAVPRGSGPDLFLSRSIRNAEIVRLPGGAEPAREALLSGRADAYGENAHFLHGVMARLPAGARILEGRFNVVQMAIALPKGRGAEGLDYLRQFVAEMKRDGSIARAIGQAGLRGVHVAPD